MKKLLLPLAFAAVSLSAMAQGGSAAKTAVVPVPMSGVPNDQLFKDASNIYFYNEFYMVDGRRVAGFPFLFHDWQDGVITTADDRVFAGYKVKYNIFGQSVFFHNGTDSLEVNEKVKEFLVMVPSGDTLEKYRFVNADQYEETKKPSYYLVLADKPAYQLLKLHRKAVVEADKTLPVKEARKMFSLETSYYFYNKTSKKITRIKANGANITDLLGLDPGAASALKLASYDFTLESEFLRFFEDYYQTK